MSITTGDRIKHLREKRGLSSRELSRIAGINNATISEVEGGKIKNPSVQNLVKIALALGVSLDFLVLGESLDPKEIPTQGSQKAFFRKYENLSDGTKKKLSDILEVLDTDD